MRSRRLAVLERLAAMAERTSRIRLAQANQELQRKQRQQQQLEEYDAEYARRWIAAGRAGLGGQSLGQIGAFRHSLGRTLDIQAGAVRGAQTGLAREVSAWQRQRERLRVFAGLVETAQAAEQREAERKAQRMLDDLAARPRDSD
jgi:flagellar export protein FliJ